MADASVEPSDAEPPHHDVPPAGDGEGSDGGEDRRPSPVLLGLLVVVLIGFGVWKFVLKKDDADPAPSAGVVQTLDPTTPTGQSAAGATWAEVVPKTRPGGVTDATTLDAREVAPARFGHQVQLAQKALKPSEQIDQLRVQADGTIVVLAVAGTAARWIATKKDLSPAPVPAAAGLTGLQALTPADISDRVPAKLVRAMSRAKGVAPGELVLSHTAGGVLGDVASWTLKWPGISVSLYATADGHTIKS